MQRYISLCLALFIIVISSGCDMLPLTSGTATEEIALAPTVDTLPLVSVTGKVIPAVWGMVSTQTGGMVVEVLVETGDVIQAGDVLVRFDDTDARLAIQQAEVTIAAAEAQVAQLAAGPRETDVAVMEAQIMAATTVISQTQTQYNHLWSGSHEANVAAAQAELAAAQAEELVTRQTHDDTMRCERVTMPDGSKKDVCPMLGTYEERTRLAWHAAVQRVAAAEAQLEALDKGFWGQVNDAKAAITVAESQREVSEAQLAQLLAGTPPEAIAVAEAAVAQAEASLDAAEVALDRTVVTAPYGGTVGQVSVKRGEFVAPGQPLLTVGDLETLRVETTDLDEIDVARIVEGQAVVLTFDAFPDAVFTGQITRIAPMAESGSGGVNYTVIVEMESVPEGLRWGMTAFVDVEVE